MHDCGFERRCAASNPSDSGALAVEVLLTAGGKGWKVDTSAVRVLIAQPWFVLLGVGGVDRGWLAGQRGNVGTATQRAPRSLKLAARAKGHARAVP
jgi:hypothetical protein